jgi:hypothetical protein
MSIVTHLSETRDSALFLLHPAFLDMRQEHLRRGENRGFGHVATRNTTVLVTQEGMKVQNRVAILHVGELANERHHVALQGHEFEGPLHLDEVHLVLVDR